MTSWRSPRVARCARSARALGIRSVGFCSTGANPGKVARMRALGATVIAAGEDFDAARGAAEAYARDRDAEHIVDGDDVRISTGAATLAVELSDAVEAGAPPAPALGSGPGGNGGLANRVGARLRAGLPPCGVFAGHAAGAPAPPHAWRRGALSAP